MASEVTPSSSAAAVSAASVASSLPAREKTKRRLLVRIVRVKAAELQLLLRFLPLRRREAPFRKRAVQRIAAEMEVAGTPRAPGRSITPSGTEWLRKLATARTRRTTGNTRTTTTTLRTSLLPTSSRDGDVRRATPAHQDAFLSSMKNSLERERDIIKQAHNEYLSRKSTSDASASLEKTETDAQAGEGSAAAANDDAAAAEERRKEKKRRKRKEKRKKKKRNKKKAADGASEGKPAPVDADDTPTISKKKNYSLDYSRWDRLAAELSDSDESTLTDDFVHRLAEETHQASSAGSEGGMHRAARFVRAQRLLV